jgi:acyl-CoA thioester hydrolase
VTSSRNAPGQGAQSARGLVSESRLRVRYAETDQMGVVYHSNLFIWFEVGRVDFLRQLGVTYRDIEREDGCYLPVVDAHCRYKSPVRYDDEVLIRTRLKNLRGSFIHFTYEALRPSDGMVFAQGETTHVVTDAEMKVQRLPEKYLRAFQGALSP